MSRWIEHGTPTEITLKLQGIPSKGKMPDGEYGPNSYIGGIKKTDDIAVINKTLRKIYAKDNLDPSSEIDALRLIWKDRDLIPPVVDVAFLHGRSYNDDDEVMKLGAELVNSGRAKYLLINGSEGERYGGNIPGEAWPGRANWVHRCIYDLGVDPDKIFFTEATFNTRQDTDGFIKSAKEWGWKTGIFITLPHQIVRAYLGTVKVLEETGNPVEVFALTPENVDWDVQVYGSQGKDNLPRQGHIFEESKRIPVYQAKNHLSTYEELARYIQTRNDRTMLASK